MAWLTALGVNPSSLAADRNDPVRAAASKARADDGGMADRARQRAGNRRAPHRGSTAGCVVTGDIA